jgi:osmoprotectant transport system permease protein
MTEQFAELFENLPRYLGWHLFLSLAALAVSLAISLPIGLAASRRPRFAEWTLAVAGVIQTVPSLALLAMMVFVLGGLIGFLPAFIALTLYSILPILANTIVGIRGVDPALTEAARGLGMSDRQMLFRVELPLAAPVIIGGIRTATVLAVGTATLVTPVGGTSLGNYIFSGLEGMNPSATLFGCVCAALLAIALDQLIRWLEVSVARRQRRQVRVALTVVGLLVAASLYAPAHRLIVGAANRGIIASGPFTEQHILCEVLADQLQSAGFRPDKRQGMSEGIQIEALRHNQIDCMVNYSGNIWTLVMKRQDFLPREEMVPEITRYLQERMDVTCLGSLGFEDAYALALPRHRADSLGVHSLTELAQYIQRQAARGRVVRIGADSQFFERPEWRHVKKLYQIRESDIEPRAMDPTLMYGAVVSGRQVDVIVAYTSDGRIKSYDLEVLKDPLQAFPPYDALLLVSAEAARRPAFVQALQRLQGKISLELMREANRRVDEDRLPARQVGRWLWEQAVGQAQARR